MLDLSRLKGELDAEKNWRLDELRFFKNQGSDLEQALADQYRRALILLLYGHYEGFCKFAFVHYVNVINAEKLTCDEASCEIIALAMAHIFKELRDPHKKKPKWKHILPDDPKLHRLTRDREFIENFQKLMKIDIVIADDVIDLESNLKPSILRKNLYSVGLNPALFKLIDNDISLLVGLRNSIAHGASRKGITEKEYLTYERAAFRVIDQVSDDIMKAISNENFRKQLIESND